MIFYGLKEAPGVKELGQKSPGPSTRVGARPTPPGAPPYLMDDSGTPRLVPDAKKSYECRNPPRNNPRSEVSLPQASVATKNQSGAHSGTLPAEKIITRGHLHHPYGLHDEERVVHPRG